MAVLALLALFDGSTAGSGFQLGIFAVDGLRMAIIFGIFFGLFRALGLPGPLSGAVLVPLIWISVDAPMTNGD